MSVKLAEHHLEVISLKGGCTGSSDSVYTCQNVELLEILCRFPYFVGTQKNPLNESSFEHLKHNVTFKSMGKKMIIILRSKNFFVWNKLLEDTKSESGAQFVSV